VHCVAVTHATLVRAPFSIADGADQVSCATADAGAAHKNTHVATLPNVNRGLRAARPPFGRDGPGCRRPTSLNTSRPLGHRFPPRTAAGPSIAAALRNAPITAKRARSTVLGSPPARYKTVSGTTWPRPDSGDPCAGEPGRFNAPGQCQLRHATAGLTEVGRPLYPCVRAPVERCRGGRWRTCPRIGVVGLLGLICRPVAVRVRLHRRWGSCDGTFGWMGMRRSRRWAPLRFASGADGHDRVGGGAGERRARERRGRGRGWSVHVRGSGDDRHWRAVWVTGRVGHDVVSVEWFVRGRHGRVWADRELDQPGRHVRERLVAVSDGADRRESL
jgi:hypothetical protein